MTETYRWPYPVDPTSITIDQFFTLVEGGIIRDYNENGILRGGSWNGIAYYDHIKARYYLGAGSYSNVQGLRCVLPWR
jgi:hypothetical protein